MFVPNVRKGFLSDGGMIISLSSKNHRWTLTKHGKLQVNRDRDQFFSERQSCPKLYRKSLKEFANASARTYTNDLHEALLKKTAQFLAVLAF